MTRPEVDDATENLLQRWGFDAPCFEALRARLRAGDAGAESNRITGDIVPPSEGDVRPLPPVDSAERRALTEAGQAAIAEGQVGIVTLAGGMATRFGGVVKATVDALDGRSFLELKLRDVARLAERVGGRVPAYLMTSFATDAEVTEAAAALSSDAAPARAFHQGISLRLEEDGSLFHGADGQPSAYAPGHGDLPFALQSSGALAEFRAAGGRLLYMSNVDNLGATLDPAVIGAHLESRAEITAEVVDKLPGDKGGAPARVDGNLEIVEAFRFPEDFDQDRVGVFNTNSFVLSVEALEGAPPLSWFAVRKTVDGRAAVQFERLVGQLTAFHPSAFVRVERAGVDGRFQPVKDPGELVRRRPEIQELLEARQVL